MNESTLEYYGFTIEEFPFPDERSAWQDAEFLKNVYSLDDNDYNTIYQILKKYI